MGTWPGPSIMVCTWCFQGDSGELAQGVQLGKLGLIVGVGRAARAQAVAQAESVT